MTVKLPSLQSVKTTMRHPAVVTFGLLWIASGLAIALFGGWELMIWRLPIIFAFWLMVLITIVITRPAPPTGDESAQSARKTIFQLILIVVVITLTTIRGLVFHQVIPPASPLAFTIRLDDVLGLFANSFYYFLLPLLLLLLLGTGIRELGFGRGHHVWRVTALWCAIPVTYWIVGLIGGSLAIGGLLHELANNAIQNGFFEEFLFRGALQTRLRLLTSPTAAVVITSLVFGLWHLGLGFSEAGSLPGAIAVCIFVTAAHGLAFSIIMERTRNLIAPSIVHVVTNSLG